MIFNLIGSLGLFLLGMWLMTEGLKLAGGNALQTLLGSWTSSRPKALASGIFITALVQSSSAVTVATIGFVNASLLTFQQALWVVFGSNVGTTFTAWIVTVLGFSVKIGAFTFPLIGIGAMLRIFSTFERGKALGMALAGFGLLFMGIDSLQENFSGYAQHINIEAVLSGSGHPTLWALAIGFLLTLLTQSSSAAIAIILTAVASGVAGLEVAAAAVIGANIGTTSTALLAAIGATPNAKRLAWAHLAFNALTAMVALLILPIFWMLVSFVAQITNAAGNLTLMLAIFHTLFNLLGLLLIWPVAPKLSELLMRLYEKPASESDKSAHLDSNVATIPDLAIRTMTLELKALQNDIGQIVLPSSHTAATSRQELSRIQQRLQTTNKFIALALKSELTKQQGQRMAAGLSVSYHLNTACNTITEALERTQAIIDTASSLPRPLSRWFSLVNDFNHLLHHGDTLLRNEQFDELKEHYRSIKTLLIEAAVAERLDVTTVDNALLAASLSRRFVEQLMQAIDALQTLLPEP